METVDDMENRIVVECPDVSRNKITYNYCVTGAWKDAFTDIRTFDIVYDTDISSIPSGVAIIPMLANILPVAWIYDAYIKIQTCDKDFYESIPTFKEGYMKMYPAIDFRGKLEVGQVVNYDVEDKEGAIVFFSGGVDSFDTLIRHQKEMPVLLSLWGADLTLQDECGWLNVKQRMSHTAQEFGILGLTAKSGFRDFLNYDILGKKIKESKDNWWHGFQHGIGIISHSAPVAYMLKKKNVYLASSYTEQERPFLTCASAPSIDNKVKFFGCKIWHDGYEYTRQEKIAHILQYTVEHEYKVFLRVCWEKTDGLNCCQCEKCFRTLSAIYAEGFEPKEYGFEYTQSMLLQLKERIEKNRGIVISPVYELCYRDIQKRMRENYRKEEVCDGLKWFYDVDIKRICKKSVVKRLIEKVKK